jgi:predicted enzyme related to lactoylglutathione lyase
MAKVIHFDLIAADVDRAIAFYSAAFDWKITKWDGPMEYWLIQTGETENDGLDGGLSKGEPNMRDGELTLGVDSLDDAIAKVTAAGGKLTREAYPIQGIGHLAMIEDTEGNQFGLMESDPSAS